MQTTACPMCGATVRAGTQFCQNCGADVRQAQEGADTLDASAPSPGSPPPPPRQPDLMELLRQATQGEYDIIGELGRGGMATVYLADDLMLERKVAIKVMSPGMFSGADLAERFKREARTVGGLSHPHVIPIYAVRETPQLLFFVMKYVEGRGLDQILKEFGPLPIRMVQAIITQVASALQHAHRKQIIHRDVKPANIMLDDDGWAVVTDFGIAKVARQAELTRTGSTVGTPFYMSPEQCGGTHVVPASDQYSLGIVAYEMLTGRVPFRGSSIMDIMRGHFVEPPPPIQDLRRDCPAGLAKVVMRMLAKEPEERYASLEDVVTAIDLAPLASDDPTRTQMVELARSGSRSRPSLPTGRPPLPRPRNTVSALNNARTPPQGKPIIRRASREAAPRRTNWKPWLLTAGALGFLGLGWSLSFLLMRPPTQAPVSSNPPAASPLGDSGAARTATPSQVASGLPDSIEPLARPVENAKPAVVPETVSAKPKPAPTRTPFTRQAEPKREPEEYERVPVDEVRLPRPERPRTTAAPVTPPVVLPQVGYIAISTRTPNAMLYINGLSRELGSRMDTIPVKPGPVALRIMAPGCEPDDKNLTVSAGTTVPVGRFNAKCPTN